jgi:hypothetical protein
LVRRIRALPVFKDIANGKYVGFPYAGWWKEREEKGRGKICSLRELFF